MPEYNSLKGRQVRDAMRVGVATCAPDTPLPQATQQMIDLGLRSLAVIDATGRLLGVLGHTEIVDAQLNADERRWTRLQAADLMEREVPTIAQTVSLREAADLMTSRQIHRLIVLADADGPPIGVLSMTDLMRFVVGSD